MEFSPIWWFKAPVVDRIGFLLTNLFRLWKQWTLNTSDSSWNGKRRTSKIFSRVVASRARLNRMRPYLCRNGQTSSNIVQKIGWISAQDNSQIDLEEIHPVSHPFRPRHYSEFRGLHGIDGIPYSLWSTMETWNSMRSMHPMEPIKFDPFQGIPWFP